MVKKANDENKKTDESVIGEQEAKKLVNTPQKTSKLTILLLTLIPLIAGVAAVLYYIYIFLPNTAENILRSAMNDLLQNPSGYSVSGEYVAESDKELNYQFTINSDIVGNQQIGITADAPLTDGNVKIQRVNDQSFVNFSGFVDKDKLNDIAKDFKGDLALDNELRDFSSRTNVNKNQDKWMLIPNFVFFQPVTPNSKIANELDPLNESSFIVNNYGEENNGVREYSLNVESNNIYRFAKMIDGDRIGFVTESLLLYEQNNRDFPDAITLNMAVNTKTKKIQKISFDSSAFEGASLSVTIEPDVIEEELVNPMAPTIESVLGYDVVDSVLFNEMFQVGANLADRQKITDIKAFAMAMQVHKLHTGYYPDRSEVAVGGLEFFDDAMPTIDQSFFVDSNVKTIGKNGSLYAYVTERLDSEYECKEGDICDNIKTNCDQYSDIRCHQFWAATTLSDGQEFKIVAN
ncbi:MAG: hypothetical protein M3P98_02100 [bacterium]|nr:hypothetical protein [bacterium]